MKKSIRALVTAALALTLLGCGGALAAEEPAISVQLDGQALTFTDAVPQVRDQRTFLPFRAVFEAMGATVSNEGEVITAVRGDRTLTMTIGSTDAQVTENGLTTPITMDVAPYVDNATWRTYVPVRFAAQAFGCAVGWDQAAYTAIIVDTDKLLDAALEGKSFTYLEKFNAYSKKYTEGVWDCDLTMDGSFTMLGAAMPLSVTAQGTTEGETKLDLDMNMKLDMTQLMALVQQMAGGTEALSAEDQALLNAFKTEGLNMSMRGDLSGGKLYMNISGKALEEAGMESEGVIFPNTWYSMDMNALLAGSGMDLAELIKQSSSVDCKAVAQEFLNTMTLNSATGEGEGISYEVFKQSAENLVCALSDAGFIQDGDKYVSSIDGGLNKMEISLTMENGAVAAYDMTVNMTMEEDGVAVSMLVDMGVDKNDKLSGKLTMDMAPMMAMELNITGGYTKGTTAPATEPPAGAQVVDLMEMMAAEEAASVGIIGGADGPTAVIVGQ